MARSSSPQPLTITSLNEHGYGVGQKGGQTLTVARTAPGDQVLVGASHSANRWSSADLLKVVKPGSDRVPSPCRGFEDGCGGCQWLHLSYPAQVQWKDKNLAALLRTRAGFRGVIHPLSAMDSPHGYRNKLSLKQGGGKFLFVPEIDENPVSPANCLVQTPALQRAWAALRTLKVPPLLEQLHLRSNTKGEIGLHAFAKDAPGLDASLKSLMLACPGAVGMGVTTRAGYRVVAGESSLVQSIGAASWLVPHNGFFQTNEPQASALLDLVRREAKPTRSDRVLDLYCGAGFFGLALAPLVKEVLGIEENAQSVAAAQASAKVSGLANAQFLAGDLGTVLATVPASRSEIAIVDPPREGLLPRAIEVLIARRPQRIVYISCYPQSLVRDLKLLTAAGWRGAHCTPVDMFPHTSHLEVVVTLEYSASPKG